MAVAYVGSGAYADSGVGNPESPAPSYPGSLVAGYLLIAQVVLRINRSTANTCTATGWTQLEKDVTNTTGTGSHVTYLMYKWSDGTETGTVTFTCSGVGINGAFARIHALSGVAPGSGSPSVEARGLVNPANTASVSHADIVTTGTDELGVIFVSVGDDTSTTHTLSGGSGGTLVERTENSSAVGADSRQILNTIDAPSPTTITGNTATMGTSQAFIARGFALMPTARKDVPEQVVVMDTGGW
jgi:hypothetical protein